MAPDATRTRSSMTRLPSPIILHSSSSAATMKTRNSNGHQQQQQHNTLEKNKNNHNHNHNAFHTPTSRAQKFCGTPDILISSHVREGPGRIMNAPVPSVFNDDRGSIHRLRVGGKRINLSHSEAGIMRSGHLYPITTHVFVISGTVEVWLLQQTTGTKKVVHTTGDTFEIPPYTPHILNFVTHCILTEWWEQHGDAQCWIFQPFRNIVDVQNAMISTNTVNRSTGYHQLLIPQNDYEQRELSSSSSSSSTVISSIVTALCYTSIGITVGTVLGIVLSSSPHYYYIKRR